MSPEHGDEPTGGPVGWLQKKLVTRLLRPVYVREIEQLGRVAAEWATGGRG